MVFKKCSRDSFNVNLCSLTFAHCKASRAFFYISYISIPVCLGNCAVLIPKCLGRTISQLSELHDVGMCFKCIDLGFSDLGRRMGFNVTAHVAGSFGKGVCPRTSEEGGLYVATDSLIQVGLKDAGVSMIHDLLQ